MRESEHIRIYKKIQKWMDEPIIRNNKGFEVYGYLQYYCFLIPRKIKVKVTIQNHQCWRHTIKEVLHKFSKAFSGEYEHNLILEIAKQHLRDDLIDEDYILIKRSEVIKKEFLKLSNEHKFPVLEKIHSFLFNPQGCFQELKKFEYIRKK